MNEIAVSQLPAARLLARLGWRVLGKARIDELRGGNRARVFLEPVLREFLRGSPLRWGGREEPLNDANIAEIIRRAHEAADADQAKQAIWDMLTLGATVTQHIGGRNRDVNVPLVDWETIENNRFHLAPEFSVLREGDAGGDAERRPDIVLFVNGLPLVVIECKNSDVDASAAVSQMIRNQKEGEIPRLFAYAQLLLCVNKSAALYGVSGAPVAGYMKWREKEWTEEEMAAKRTGEISAEDAAALAEHFPGALEAPAAELTEQDIALVALCSPARLLDMTRNFMLFDGGQKKAARWNQYRAVKETLRRVGRRDGKGARQGGVIWHTQGSGKSLTMVLLARALFSHLGGAARVVLVTDRVDLDKQIRGIFQNAEMEPKRAATGTELIRLIQGGAGIITTVINKFKSAAREKTRDDSDNIFMLVDEGHRTEHGELHQDMRRVFPKACYVCFTGTPLLKEDKTRRVFGDIISAYTTKEALEDGAVLPLRYEACIDDLDINANIDDWYDKVTVHLSPEQKEKYKRKFSARGVIGRAEKVIYARAHHAYSHFLASFRGTGLTAQLVAPDKDAAVCYKKHMDEIARIFPSDERVTSEVIISAPDSREGHEAPDEGETTDKVANFWAQMMERYGDERRYNDAIINAYKAGDRPDILIVVSKLLTGFDAPRNACLYLAKKMEGHNLLQAIARVNRVLGEEVADKQHGLVVDYEGILGNLEKALAEYGALAGYDEADAREAVFALSEKVKELPQKLAKLRELFKGVAAADRDAHLADEGKRKEFNEALMEYAGALKTALSSSAFVEETDEATMREYKGALKEFLHLRKTVALRYGGEIDHKAIERHLKKLVNEHLSAGAVNLLHDEPLDIHDAEKLRQRVERLAKGRRTQNDKDIAAADVYLLAIEGLLRESKNSDPAFYEKFSAMLRRMIDQFMEERRKDWENMSGAEHLRRAMELHDAVAAGADEDVPPSLRADGDAKAYFRAALQRLREHCGGAGEGALLAAAEALARETKAIMAARDVVDLPRNRDAQNKILNDLDDYLCDKLPDGVIIPEEHVADISVQLLEIYRHRRKRQ